jgi:hypothetical protein
MICSANTAGPAQEGTVPEAGAWRESTPVSSDLEETPSWFILTVKY